MRKYQDIEIIFDLIADYYRSIKLELAKGGFGGCVFEAGSKLYNYIIGNTEGYRCDWASNNHLTQKVADVADRCYNFMVANEGNLYKKSSHYLAIIMFLDRCINDIKLTTGIEPQQGEQAPASQEPSPTTKVASKETPAELNTDRARAIFAKAVEAGLMTEQYKWLKTASLYGYFVDKVSDVLGIKDNADRIKWAMFGKIIPNHSKMLNTAKQAINDYKNKGLPPPQDDDIVDRIIKETR